MSDILYGKRLLIVDDSDDDTRILLNRVSQFHFNYETAMTLAHGYSAADRFKPDLMLVDVFIPFDSTGTVADFQRVLEFVSKYATLSAVVMMTGDLDPTHVKMAIAAGACEWIPKTNLVDSPDDFRDRVERAYRNRMLALDGDLSPGQKILLQAMQANREETIIMRATSELAVNKVAKQTKEANGQALEAKIKLATDQAFKRGEQSMLVKVRTKKISVWAGAGVSTAGLLWIFREFIYAAFVAIKHRVAG